MRITTACAFAALSFLASNLAVGSESRPTSAARVIEWTIKSHKAYTDPFNDVDLDVIFERDGHAWRVPTFWRGGSRWRVRFGAPAPGRYGYRLESTDKSNPDLNGHSGYVTVKA